MISLKAAHTNCRLDIFQLKKSLLESVNSDGMFHFKNSPTYINFKGT